MHLAAPSAMGVAPGAAAKTPERLTSAAVAEVALDVIEGPKGTGTAAGLDDGTSAARDALHGSKALPPLAGAARAAGDQQRRGEETEDETETEPKHRQRDAFHAELPCNRCARRRSARKNSSAQGLVRRQGLEHIQKFHAARGTT